MAHGFQCKLASAINSSTFDFRPVLEGCLLIYYD